ncbi:MAG: hypothetical protein N2115_03330 [bacterium]|nr:hypothetical protein [bacterium]
MKYIVLFLSCLILFAGCVASKNTVVTEQKSNPVIAEEESLYKCYRVKETPVLDGRLDDICWQSIPAARCFFLLGGNEFAMVKPSIFKAGWDDDNFYFGFVAQEPEVQKIIAKRQDGDKFLWAEDSVELFLIPPEKEAWQFMINAIGSRWNGRGSTGTTLPLENWQVKTYIGQDFWSLEAKIPFKIVGKVPTDGEKWRLNVGRNNLTGPVEERVSCWPRILKSFHEIDNFGILIFKKVSLTPQSSRIQEDRINSPRYNLIRKKIADLAKAYKNDYRRYIEKAFSISSLSEQADQLVRIWIPVVDYHEKMEKEKTFNLDELYSVLMKVKGLKEKTEDLKQRVKLESLFE